MNEENKNRKYPQDILPVDTWGEILSYLSLIDRAKAAPTCKLFKLLDDKNRKNLLSRLSRHASNLLNLLYYSEVIYCGDSKKPRTEGNFFAKQKIIYRYPYIQPDGITIQRDWDEENGTMDEAIENLLAELLQENVTIDMPGVAIGLMKCMLNEMEIREMNINNKEDNNHGIYRLYIWILVFCEAEASKLLLEKGMDTEALFEEFMIAKIEDNSFSERFMQSKHRNAHIRLFCQYVNHISTKDMQKLSEPVEVFDEMNVIFYAFCRMKLALDTSLDISNEIPEYNLYSINFEKRFMQKYPRGNDHSERGKWEEFLSMVEKEQHQLYKIHITRSKLSPDLGSERQEQHVYPSML